MIPGLLFVTMGGASIYYSKVLAKKTATFYTKILHRQFNEAGYQLMYVLSGIMFLAVGMLELFGIL